MDLYSVGTSGRDVSRTGPQAGSSRQRSPAEEVHGTTTLSLTRDELC